MDYFGINESVLYPNNSFASNNDSVSYDQKQQKRNFGKLRDNLNLKKDKGKKEKIDDFKEGVANQLRRNLSKKRTERPATTIIRKEVNQMWNEALREERKYIREHSPDRVSRITALSNPQGIGANGNKRGQEAQNFGKRTDINLEFSIPMPVEKKKGTLFRDSNGNRRKIFSKTWWSNVPIGAYLFFLGFLFFPLWYVGAFWQFRKDNTVEAEIQRNRTKKSSKKESNVDGNREWKSKVDKNKTNNGNEGNSHIEISKMDDPENSESWNWGLGGVGDSPEAINVNFMSGIEEFEKHKLAENEKWWRKLNMIMSILVTVFLFGLIIVKRKSIFGSGDDTTTTSSESSISSSESSSSNNNSKGNNNGSNMAPKDKPTIPLNNNITPNRNGDGGEIND